MRERGEGRVRRRKRDVRKRGWRGREKKERGRGEEGSEHKVVGTERGVVLGMEVSLTNYVSLIQSGVPQDCGIYCLKSAAQLFTELLLQHRASAWHACGRHVGGVGRAQMGGGVSDWRSSRVRPGLGGQWRQDTAQLLCKLAFPTLTV